MNLDQYAARIKETEDLQTLQSIERELTRLDEGEDDFSLNSILIGALIGDTRDKIEDLVMDSHEYNGYLPEKHAVAFDKIREIWSNYETFELMDMAEAVVHFFEATDQEGFNPHTFGIFAGLLARMINDGEVYIENDFLRFEGYDVMSLDRLRWFFDAALYDNNVPAKDLVGILNCLRLTPEMVEYLPGFCTKVIEDESLHSSGSCVFRLMQAIEAHNVGFDRLEELVNGLSKFKRIEPRAIGQVLVSCANHNFGLEAVPKLVEVLLASDEATSRDLSSALNACAKLRIAQHLIDELVFELYQTFPQEGDLEDMASLRRQNLFTIVRSCIRFNRGWDYIASTLKEILDIDPLERRELVLIAEAMITFGIGKDMIDEVAERVLALPFEADPAVYVLMIRAFHVLGVSNEPLLRRLVGRVRRCDYDGDDVKIIFAAYGYFGMEPDLVRC